MKKIINTLITKTGLNIAKMLRYGSIACISMFTIILFFGEDNAMLAFPIALTSIALSFENIRIKTVQKTFNLILLNCTLVLLSYFATRHLYIGIIINFITIFFIGYFLSFSFNPKIYKPFLMMFIFTSFSHDTISGLLNKIFAIIFGCILTITLNFILDKNNKNDLLMDFNPSIKLLFSQIENVKNNEFSLETHSKISKNMREINYSIYISKSKHYLTNLHGKFKLDMFLHISMLNNILYKEFYKSQNPDSHFLNLLTALSSFFTAEDFSIIYNVDDLLNFLSKISSASQKFYSNKTCEFICILQNLVKTLANYKLYTSKDLNKPFKPWHRSSLNKYSYLLKKNLYKGSTRLYFSLRISLTLTACLFFSHLFEISKIIWIAITIMSVMQIYYEETLSKGKDRIKGNLIGLTLFVLLSFIHIQELAWVVLFISLFLTYGFKEYYKLSIFTTLASLSVTSLYLHINEVALVRISLVLLGLLIVFFANKFLFPTNLKSGIQILIKQLLIYNYKLVGAIKSDNRNIIADILVHISLTSEKLSIRNAMLQNNEINKLIESNNSNMLEIAYYELIK
ncbi:MAG: FUSC family protein [Sarcina sp.]